MPAIDAVQLLSSYKVITDINLTEDGEPEIVKRMIKERLFTLPWKPFVKTKTIIPKIPMQTAFLVGGDTLIMHPFFLEQLKLHLGD